MRPYVSIKTENVKFDAGIESESRKSKSIKSFIFTHF